MSDLLDRLLGAPGTYWGVGDGPESGPFVGRIDVKPMLSAVLLHYEAHGAAGIQHVEFSMLGRSTAGLELRTVVSEFSETLTFSEQDAGHFVLDAPRHMTIVIETPAPGTLSYAWWWAPSGEDVIEQSKVHAQILR